MSMQQTLLLSGSAGQLEAVLHLPKNKVQAIAVIAHPLPIMGGTMDNKVVTTTTRALLELDFACLRFNFRGVGQSAGQYEAGDGEVLDVITAVDYLRQQFPDLPLLCAGFSFGAYVQARAAEQTNPTQLLLIAPAVGRFAMPQVAEHTLIIHGSQDDVVELSALIAWAEPQQLPIIVLAGAGHFFHGRLTQLKQILQQNMTKFRHQVF